MENRSPQKGRETALAYGLLLMLGAVLLFFLNFVTWVVQPIVFNVVVIASAIALFGYFHYVCWGHSMSQETAGEREEEELRRRLETEEHRRPHDAY